MEPQIEEKTTTCAPPGDLENVLLTHSVQTGTGPTRSAGKFLCALELILKVGLDLCGVVQEKRSVVEALDTGVGGAHGSGSSSPGSVGRGEGICAVEAGRRRCTSTRCSGGRWAVGLIDGCGCSGNGRGGFPSANHYDSIIKVSLR